MNDRDSVSNARPDVLIIGSGAVGMMLACDLLQQGIDHIRIVDRRDQLIIDDPHSRAVLIWPRMLELLRRIDVVKDIVEAGHQITGISYYSKGRRLGTVPMDRLGTATPFTLSLPQREVERVLSRRLKELGGTVDLGVTLAELDNSGDYPRATLQHRDGTSETVRPRWLVGSDGVGSTTRRLLNIGYPGREFELGISIGDFPVVSGPVGCHVEYHYSKNGLLPIIPLGKDVVRIASIVPPVGDGWESFTRQQLQTIIHKRSSLPYEIDEPNWIRTFQPRPGIATRFRDGRCLLVGDSAHCVIPLGGQGLNLGIQDVFNLGWKLGGVIRGEYRETLLDSYDEERRRAAHQVTAIVDKQVLAARQTRPAPSLLRDTLIRTARELGMIDRLVAPLLSQVGLAYGKPQLRSLLRPQPRRARPGQRVPLFPRSSEVTERDVLGLTACTVFLWPGRSPDGRAWETGRDQANAVLSGKALVRDLAELPTGVRQSLIPSLGRRAALLIVRPDGHLAQRLPLSRPRQALDFLSKVHAGTR